MAWASVLKTTVCFIGAGALYGLLRGSIATGVLSVALLLAICMVVAGAIILADYALRKYERRRDVLPQQKLGNRGQHDRPLNTAKLLVDR